MISILKYIASKISIGGFTNKGAWKKQPFVHLTSVTLANNKAHLINMMMSVGILENLATVLIAQTSFYERQTMSNWILDDEEYIKVNTITVV